MKILFFFTLIATIAVLTQGEPQKQSISQHVIRGKMAPFRKLPWQALLIVYFCREGNAPNCNKTAVVCGGSLISDRWILTAAHCMKNSPTVNVKLGTVHMDKAIISMNSTDYVIHPNYIRKNYNNDIALLKLPESVNLKSLHPYVKAINLPTRSMARKSFEGTKATVSGFGYHDESRTGSKNLRYAKLEVISNEESRFYYEPGEIINSTICAMGTDDITQISCNGDSGGPLVTEINKRPYIIGSVSFGTDKGCLEGFPDCFTRITSYLDWISKVTGIQIKY